MSGNSLLDGPVGVIANVSKANAVAAARTIVDALGRHGFTCRLEAETARAAGITAGVAPLGSLLGAVTWLVVVGGDGTILRAARESAPHGLPILGVNPGESLGFMADTLLNELPSTLAQIRSGNCEIIKRATIAAQVAARHGTPEALPFALNDVTFQHGGEARLIVLDVILGSEFFTTYEADGLIFATPTGSTAHSLSAGGPIVFPTTDALVLTPICPHTLSNRPIILPRACTIDVRNGAPGREVHLSIDGQITRLLGPDDTVSLRLSDHSVKFIHCRRRSYIEVLREKLHWRGRLREEKP
ncbi:NAD(+)/NADH kinase [bacterium]|nr:NAD(+)/NADH kinase [bacterium]